jgi:hypothetical protein
LLVLGRGFGRRRPVGLILRGLAAAELEVVKAGGKTIEAVRIRITNERWRAIGG